MTCCRFLTTWLLDAPVDRVWDVLHDTERWMNALGRCELAGAS